MQYFDKKAVGERIREVRKNKNMTQSELSEKLEYTNERQLQRIESGETGCSVDKLMEISQILHISTDYLIFGSEHNENRDEEDNLLEILLSGRTKEQKKYVYLLLKTAVDNLDLIS